MRQKLHLSTLQLVLSVLFTCWGTEFIATQTDFNVYRVLDLPFSTLALIALFLCIQYWLYKDLGHHTQKIYEAWKEKTECKYQIVAVSAVGWAAWFALSKVSLIWLIFPVALVGVFAFYFFTKYLSFRFFLPMLTTLIGLAAFNASMVFWVHELDNEGIHEQYTRMLAERQDPVAESIFKQWLQDKTPLQNQTYWEKKWLDNDYLAKNYTLAIRNQLKSENPAIKLADSGRKYELSFATGALQLTLKKNFSPEVYLKNIPYKQLENLSSFLFTVVDNGEVVLSNTNDFDKDIMNVPLPPEGTIEKIHWNGYDVRVYNHQPGRYVLIGEPLSEVLVWISNFSFFFTWLLLVIVLFEILKAFVFNKSQALRWSYYPIDFKMQSLLWGLTLLFFYIISFATFTFLVENNKENGYEEQISKAKALRELTEKVITKSKVDWKSISNSLEGTIDKYNLLGQLESSSLASVENSPAPKKLDAELLKQLNTNPSAILVNLVSDETTHYRTYIQTKVGKETAVLALNVPELSDGTAHDIPIIMSKLLNVYVALLLITWCTGWVLLNILTKPLQMISDSLHSFQLGSTNKKLTWTSDDSIGLLVNSYNKMVDKVERTTQELMQKEREGAWQIMAQQIAHEINSHLTPLKLKIQYLSMMLRNPVDTDRIEGISGQLVEKIDKLSGVARQFKLFANLEKPQGNPLEVLPFMDEMLEVYKENESVDVVWFSELSAGQNPIIVMEEQHLKQVFDNIMDNAIHAIPEDRKGLVQVSVRHRDNLLFIEIADNGCGIEPDIAENLFNPSFSTNNTNTGLGLSVCARIIQFYGGKIDFYTEVGVGTTFIIQLQLERIATTEPIAEVA